MTAPRWPLVLALGLAQTLAWASSYYLLAILAAPMAAELRLPVPLVYAGFSLALVVSALVGPTAGRCIDRFGGRPVLMTTNLVFAAGLAGLGLMQGPLGLFAAWVLLGLGIGSGLYDAAFAALVRLHGQQARGAITGITLIAGFASTVGWPLTTWFEAQWGWRGACLGWAGVHLLLGLPLNACLPRLSAPHAVAAPTGPLVHEAEGTSATAPAPVRRQTLLLSLVFAITWFVSTAMASHLPALLQACGLSLAAAVAMGALVGPSQVAARWLEFGLMRRISPLRSARLAAMAHPLGVLLLALVGPPAAAVFVCLHGAGNGVLTIAKGTLPLLLFGPHGYGQRQGVLMLPARIAQAAAPVVFGLCLDQWGAQALWLSAGLGVVAWAALMGLRPRVRL